MNSYELLKLLLQKLDEYAAQAIDANNLSMEEFLFHLEKNADIDKLKNNLIHKNPSAEKAIPEYLQMNIERVITQQFLFLYRYIKYYTRSVFTDTDIRSIDEFSFLATAMQFDSISKTELIRKNVIEKSSGIEIINRLIQQSFFIQFDNPDDKRSQLIAITENGRTALFNIFSKMNILGQIATGDLTNSEKNHLAFLLKKLDNFHYENYNNKKLQNLEDFLP